MLGRAGVPDLVIRKASHLNGRVGVVRDEVVIGLLDKAPVFGNGVGWVGLYPWPARVLKAASGRKRGRHGTDKEQPRQDEDDALRP
jgi:hypothetical protein